MKKILKKEMLESQSGEIYEVLHFEETVKHEDEEITKIVLQILKTPYRNQEVEVTNDTKSLIAKIAKGGTI